MGEPRGAGRGAQVCAPIHLNFFLPDISTSSESEIMFESVDAWAQASATDSDGVQRLEEPECSLCREPRVVPVS